MRGICLLAVLWIGCGDDGAPDDAALPDGGGDALLPADGGMTDADGTDAGGTDAGGTDAGPPPCDTAGAYAGDPAWPYALVAGASARYCGTFNEVRTLREEVPAKAVLTFVPGRYPLPDEPGMFDLSIPVCIELPGGGFAAPEAGGRLVHTLRVEGTDTVHRYEITRPFRAGTVTRELRLSLTLVTRPGEPGDLLLDGAPTTPPLGPYHGMLLCGDALCETMPTTAFDSCTFEDASRVYRHLIDLDDGSHLEMELRIESAPDSTEPGVFSESTGTFRGLPFVQRDYWQLVYNPAHHHFQRDFAVLFDAPIDGACGFELVDLSPFAPEPTRAAHAIGCDLTRIEPLAITADSTTGP